MKKLTLIWKLIAVISCVSWFFYSLKKYPKTILGIVATIILFALAKIINSLVPFLTTEEQTIINYAAGFSSFIVFGALVTSSMKKDLIYSFLMMCWIISGTLLSLFIFSLWEIYEPLSQAIFGWPALASSIALAVLIIAGLAEYYYIAPRKYSSPDTSKTSKRAMLSIGLTLMIISLAGLITRCCQKEPIINNLGAISLTMLTASIIIIFLSFLIENWDDYIEIIEINEEKTKEQIFEIYHPNEIWYP